jgi:hypothetical protein
MTDIASSWFEPEPYAIGVFARTKLDSPTPRSAAPREVPRVGRSVVERSGSSTPSRTTPASHTASSLPSVPPVTPRPPVPPRRLGPPTLSDAQGNVYYKSPIGGEEWRPATQFGIPVRDTTIGGFPAHKPTIGPRLQARDGLFGPPATGPEGQPLYERPTGPFFR